MGEQQLGAAAERLEPSACRGLPERRGGRQDLASETHIDGTDLPSYERLLHLTPQGFDFCAMGNFGPHNLHENRPESFVSEEIVFATYHNAGVRVFDIRDQYQPKEIAYWVPPTPQRMLDPRPRVARNALTCDCYVTREGLIFATDWNAGLHVLEYRG